jgi:restriction system protein
MKLGDVVLCPDGQGAYHVGEISSEYFYVADSVLPHRRKVNWLSTNISREAMSDGLRNSAGSIGTVSNLTKHNEELERLLSGQRVVIQSSDETIEDPSTFALEKHLEEFLITNWNSCELSRSYDLLEEDGEIIGQQYPTDTGFIDILAVSKDQTEILVIELKKGRASDAVVGQVQRYMGYVLDEVAEEHQKVRGCIIALEDDLRIRRALRINPSIDFYRYEVSFRLERL